MTEGVLVNKPVQKQWSVAWVVFLYGFIKFPREGYKINVLVRGNYCILGKDIVPSDQKLGIILDKN